MNQQEPHTQFSKFDKFFMDTAGLVANLSTAVKLKVGSVATKNNNIIAVGYNGTPSGWDNTCEDEIRWPNGTVIALKTKPEVLHAETNMIAKLSRSTQSSEGCSVYVTAAPCLDCAKILYQAGIAKVFYKESYKTEDGINFLLKSGIPVIKLG